MKNYFDLIKKLGPLDTFHCGPEMDKAYKLLSEYYINTRIISYPCGKKINHWSLPPYWNCKKAILKDSDGNIIADKSRNNLEVFSYSPSFRGEIGLEELQKHLFSDPKRPEAIIFHFRNQYRHWDPIWGFSIPHSKRLELTDQKYFVEIDSSLSFDKELVQADLYHKGENPEIEYLFLGHFDHPSMVNDGLAGCIAAFEIINRLKNIKTRFSYRAFASVEIVGSMAYLHNDKMIQKNTKEALFLGFSGIKSPLIYQKSYFEKSKIDLIVEHLLFFNNEDNSLLSHREIAGNDENIFDSVGYEIPTGTLMRWPFPEYHSNFDNVEITSKDKIEEVVNFGLRIVHILENDRKIIANYKGVPCLSNPDINLYLSPEVISNIVESDQLSKISLNDNSFIDYINYLNDNSNLLYPFMNNVVRLADGEHTILDISRKSGIPFFFAEAYINEMVKKDLIKIIDD